MKVIVLGAGIIGTASAWFLQKAGHEVTVIDRQPGVAQETSFANGCQISAFTSVSSSVFILSPTKKLTH